MALESTSVGVSQQLDMSPERSTIDPELQEALNEIPEALEEARLEEFPIPSSLAVKNTRRLLRELYANYPLRYGIYPTMDGEIEICVQDNNKQGVALLCDSDGGALCLAYINGKRIRKQYEDTCHLPDKFILDALSALVT